MAGKKTGGKDQWEMYGLGDVQALFGVCCFVNKPAGLPEMLWISWSLPAGRKGRFVPCSSLCLDSPAGVGAEGGELPLRQPDGSHPAGGNRNLFLQGIIPADGGQLGGDGKQIQQGPEDSPGGRIPSNTGRAAGYRLEAERGRRNAELEDGG